MSTLIQILAQVAAFACLLLAVHLLRVPSPRVMPSRLLGSVFMVMALQSGLMSLVFEYGRGQGAVFLPPLALLIGPLLLLYFESIVDTKVRFTVLRSVHFIPAVFCLLEMLFSVFWLDPDLMIVLSFATYTLFLSVRVSKGVVQFSHLGSSSRVAFLWLISCLMLLAASLFIEVFILFELHQGKPLAHSIALSIALLGKFIMLSFTLLSALKNPSLFDWIVNFGMPANNPQPGSDDDILFRALVNKFDQLLINEKLYAQEGVSLQSAAKLLVVPKRQLSRAINHVHGESFSKRMNRMRVIEAKRLLSDPAGKSIIEVMLDSGFRTKSNFNKEFLAIEGVSPSDFRDATS